MRQEGSAVSDRCGRFARGGLPDLLDDELAGASNSQGQGGSEQVELAAHLETCADCRGERAKYQRIAHAIAGLGLPIDRVTDPEWLLASTAGSRGRPNAARRRRAVPLTGALLAIAAIAALLWLLR
jgi:hypothetical protein